jgi:arylsulfatase
MAERPQVAEPRDQYVYRPGTQTVPYFVAARTLNRPHSITADADIPGDGAEGVLICQGSIAGGWSFYVQDRRLHYAHNYVSRETYAVSAPDPLPAGRHQLRFEFEPTGKPDIMRGKGAPGRAQLYLDGELVGQADFPVTTPVAFNPGGMTCGANPGSAVIPDYQAPFRFTGTLHTVTVDLSGDLITDTDSEMRMAMARQ